MFKPDPNRFNGFSRAKTHSAFTLIELLVVIGVIAILAAMIVGLAGVTGVKKKISRAKAENGKYTLLIEAYKAKTGVYPPDVPGRPTTNSLYYELMGAVKTGSNYKFSNEDVVNDTTLNAAFGVSGILNSAEAGTEETAQVARLLTDVNSDQVATFANGTKSLVVAAPGPNGEVPNPWRYAVGTNAIHNPSSFDLWAEFKGKGTNIVIVGNWKD